MSSWVTFGSDTTISGVRNQSSILVKWPWENDDSQTPSSTESQPAQQAEPATNEELVEQALDACEDALKMADYYKKVSEDLRVENESLLFWKGIGGVSIGITAGALTFALLSMFAN